MVTQIWVDIGSGHGFLPDSTKPLPGPMLTSQLWGSVAFTWEQFHSVQAIILYNEFENYTFKITVTSPTGQCWHLQGLNEMVLRDSPTVWPPCAFFFILLQFYVPFYVKKKKIDNFMCLLEFECAKRLKAHSRAIPGYYKAYAKKIMIADLLELN